MVTFKIGVKKLLTSRFSLYASWFILAYCIFSFFTPFITRDFLNYNIDYPSFLEYDKENSSVTYNGAYRNSAEFCSEEANANLMAVVDVYEVHASGGAHAIFMSDADDLKFDTEVGAVHVFMKGEKLYVNNVRVEKFGKYSKPSYFSLHPWIIKKLEMTNLGKVSISNLPNSKQRIVLHGESGTTYSFGKGITLIVLASLLICIQVYFRKKHRC